MSIPLPSLISFFNFFSPTEVRLIALNNTMLRLALQELQLNKMLQGIVMISLSILKVSMILLYLEFYWLLLEFQYVHGC